MHEKVDIVVVGAGPAGMSAAIAASEGGRSVVLLDEQQALGGQIYRAVESATPARHNVLGPDYAAGESLVAALRASAVRHLCGASVWQVTRDRIVHYLHGTTSHTLEAGRVILCMGALERPMPIPGWTLPGVMTAGAAQILMKSADAVPAQPVVLAGCGPLLYLLAWQLRRAGVVVRAIVDTTDWRAYLRALPLLPAALKDWRTLLKGVRLLAALRLKRMPVYSGATDLAVEGSESASAIRFTVRGRTHRIEAGLFFLHQGVVPNAHATLALGVPHQWDKSQLCWVAERNDTGELAGVPGIYVAGDAGGIIGAQACAFSGRVAGLSAVASDTRSAELTALIVLLRRSRGARRFLEKLYQPLPQMRVPADEVLVCRCEEVTAGELRRHVRDGCSGPNQLKSFTRCGMGACQGRQCSLTTTELIAAERGVPVDEVGYLRIRPPLKPITLGELGG